MKGISKIITVVAIVVIIFLLAISGTLTSVLAILTGPKLCDVAPFEFNCFCSSGEDKIRSGFGPLGISYECIPAIVPLPYEFPIDPNDPDFDNMVVAYAQDYLNLNFPTCNTKSCDEETMFRDIVKGATFASVECGEATGPLLGTIHWRVAFNLEDGSLFPPWPTYCNSK